METISALLLSLGRKNREKDIKGLIKEFSHQDRVRIREVTYKLQEESDKDEVWRINANIMAFGSESEETSSEYQEVLKEAIYAHGLQFGFLPLDEEGNIIYLDEPYGFQVGFYHDALDKKEVLENIVRGLAEETPNLYNAYVSDAIKCEKKGALYAVTALFQDYLADDSKRHIMLAFYYKLLALAKKEGFQVIVLPDEDE